MTNLADMIRIALKGIDITSCEDDIGWWETSTGAEFGRAKLEEVLNLVNEYYEERL